jgi:hypothetical protein
LDQPASSISFIHPFNFTTEKIPSIFVHNKMKKKLIFMILCVITTIVQAQNWTGNNSSNWNDPGNWSSWPLTNDDLTIDTLNYTGAKASPVISSASVFTPASIVVQNGASLVIAANLSTSDNVEVLGTGSSVTIQGGTINIAPGNAGRFILAEGATGMMTGGTVNADQRLIVELGAQFTLNNGQINIGETLAVGDGDLSGSSIFNMNGGTIVVGEELGFENEFGNFEPSFNMNGGTLTVNGPVSWFGELPGLGRPRFNINGGNTIISGEIANLPLSTVDLYMHISADANVQFSGASIDLTKVTDSIIQTDSSAFRFLSASTFNNSGTFISSANVYVNGNTNIAGSGFYQFHNVNIAALKNLSHLAPAEIRISGNISNSGTFTPGANKVILNGTTEQTVGTSAATTFHDLVVQNSSIGILLSGNVLVNGFLDLIDGTITTTANEILVLDAAAASSEGSDSSYVNGPMTKIGNSMFDFPVGKDGDLRKIRVSAQTSVLSEFTAEYFNAPFPNTFSVNPPLGSVSAVEYWELAQAGTAGSYHAEIFWENADSSGFSSCSDLTMAQWNGSSWWEMPSAVNGICTGPDSGSVQSTTPITLSGPLTFALRGISTGRDENATGELTIFPNPANLNDQLQIVSSEEIKEISIFDMLGKNVYIRSLNSSSMNLMLNDFPSGIYQLNVITERSMSSKKLIIR